MARGYGLDSRRLKSIIEDKLREHPDLFYYIEDPYIKELSDLILDCVIEAVDSNNKKYMQDLLDEFYRMR